MVSIIVRQLSVSSSESNKLSVVSDCDLDDGESDSTGDSSIGLSLDVVSLCPELSPISLKISSEPSISCCV